MASRAKLQKIYDSAKGEHTFYRYEMLVSDAIDFLADIRNGAVVASMDVSRSGMTRRFNTSRYNMLLNLSYNQKFSWDKVKVGGCGMDMYWHLLFTTCEEIATEKELEKFNYNSACSRQTII